MSSPHISPANSEPSSPRIPRRTPMACAFCRGRKLKCDGRKPVCTNCDKRSFACAYVPVTEQPK
ncbi:hypothetical protein FIBSPDRAFT_1048831 [Athelia psychrophila]|uniref:Zn(2)-C6 fungal-type domain-containing protein n=1 Tax=Athelia psychrophila TaxID=1759441 RepID=A0A166D791_9AGAM|nr:hypothetical protein FIBSPDRAFT_1048831 [Fibularhizoctonia sp. CBS 109695]